MTFLPNIYLTEFSAVARQAYSCWNRDPASPSFGSFDRPYWGWKFKDFSDATSQYAVKLAVEYARLMERTSALPFLLEGYVDYCSQIQLKDGSFDQCYPYERTPGVVYDILSTLIYVRKSPYLVSSLAQKKLEKVIRMAASFALRVDEKHGHIANHFAQYAFELLHYAEYAGDDRALRRGENYLERLFSLQDREEGWFKEYSGPDAGYQTRTLRYLVKCAEITGKDEIWEISKKAAEFAAFLLMPDGSIHPMLGSRSTALLYPSGFEALGKRFSAFEVLAVRVRLAWEEEKVPLPSWIDFSNAVRLADDARDAAALLGDSMASTAEEKNSKQSLCQDIAAKNQQSRHFQNAGIVLVRDAGVSMYIGYAQGGVVIVYRRLENTMWELCFEDSGYVLRDEKNRAAWLTRMPGSGTLVEISENRWLMRLVFYPSRHDELTPLRFILLRILNVTVLRAQTAADIFRKIVVSRLMSARKPLPVEVLREVCIRDGGVHITDKIHGLQKILKSKNLKLYRCRRSTGLHMATARYFQHQEMETLPIEWMQEVPMDSGMETVQTITVPLYEQKEERAKNER